MKPPILVLHATGTNRDIEVAWACERAGGAAEVVHFSRLLQGSCRLADYRMLVIPGGFSSGDDLGAGKLWAVALRHRLRPELAQFIASGRPVLGICNGFQVLVKAGILPGIAANGEDSEEQSVTLTHNGSGRFECRWVTLAPTPHSPCLFTRDIEEPFACPVAHGEGRFVAKDSATLQLLEQRKLIALRYLDPANPGPAPYPANPNGSQGDIAAITNPAGNVLGMMPHPEDHILPEQHPRAHRGLPASTALRLFENGIRYAAQL